MNKPELYKRTTDILYQAYFNDTLAHNNCYACAVGNLIAGNCGYAFDTAKTERSYHRLFWAIKGKNVYTFADLPVNKDRDLWYNAINGGEVENELITARMRDEIAATGYSPEELARIEEAFESVDEPECEDLYMFNGLVAVLEVLKDIHQVTDQDLLTSNNNRFKEQYQKRIAG